MNFSSFFHVLFSFVSLQTKKNCRTLQLSHLDPPSFPSSRLWPPSAALFPFRPEKASPHPPFPPCFREHPLWSCGRRRFLRRFGKVMVGPSTSYKWIFNPLKSKVISPQLPHLSSAIEKRGLICRGHYMTTTQTMHYHNPLDPAWYIDLHQWLIFMVNVGKYTIHGSYG